jgi:hypothetical protein
MSKKSGTSFSFTFVGGRAGRFDVELSFDELARELIDRPSTIRPVTIPEALSTIPHGDHPRQA